MKNIHFRGHNKSISKSDLELFDTLDIDFDGQLKIQITKQDESFVITDAVNGHGINIFKHVKNDRLTITDIIEPELIDCKECHQSIDKDEARMFGDMCEECAIDAM